MFCEYCGTKLKENARFCHRCGKPVDEIQNETMDDSHQELDENEHGFLSLDEFVMDEKVSKFRFTNAYKIYDMSGQVVGAVEEANVSGGTKAAMLLLGSKAKALSAFEYRILDQDGNVLAIVERSGISSGIQAGRTMSIKDTNGDRIGSVQIIPHAWLPSFEVHNASAKNICNISSDWKGQIYTLESPGGVRLGTINKKWTGLARELFTTSDRYHIMLSAQVEGIDRLLVFSASVLIDIVSHEI